MLRLTPEQAQAHTKRLKRASERGKERTGAPKAGKRASKREMAVPGLSKAASRLLKPCAAYERTKEAHRQAFKASKYRNVKTVVDGHVFASKKEARRYRELRYLCKVGEINDLQIHPIYWLDFNGHVICKYVADFSYITKGEVIASDGKRTPEVVVEDVKSKPTKTPVYRLKAKLFRAIYGFPITEV